MSHSIQPNKIDLAIAHDYLIQMGGAERVVALMSDAFPKAPIYTSYTKNEGLFEEFSGKEIKNSWLQALSLNESNFKKFFLAYPLAFQSFQAPREEVVWASASTFSKFLPKKKGSTVFCYCHAPTRFIWDADEYLRSELKNPLVRTAVRATLPLLKKLDRMAAQRPDYIIANSKWVQSRIKRDYLRDSDIIHPPVDVDRFAVSHTNKDFYLIVSRLVGYKRIDLAVEAFRGLDKELRIIGDGTDRKRLEAMAPDNVKILGRLSDNEVMQAFQDCRAFIFPGCEDFGITPVEAMACGKPVIAQGRGGALETVKSGETGLHFSPTTAEALRDAVLASEQISWDSDAIRQHAETFSNDRFLEKMIQYMEERIS